MKLKKLPRDKSQKPRDQERFFTFLLLAILLMPLLGLLGCKEAGLSRFELAGQITYDGKPVPQGHLRFEPDKGQGNRGPGSSTSIIDGKYEMLPNQGTIGGPHIAYIFGTDGIPYKTEYGELIPIGRPLFPEYRVSIDLPKESSTQDFVVPTEVPGKKKKSKR